jgi:hypothetical protein
MARTKQTARRTQPTDRKQGLPSKVMRWRAKSGFHMGSPHRDRRLYYGIPCNQLNESIKLSDLKRYALEKQAEQRICARLCADMRACGMQDPEPLVHLLYVAAYERNELRELTSLACFLVTHAKNGGDKIPADCTTCHGLELWRRGIIEIAQCKRRKALAVQTSPVITVSPAQAMQQAVNEQSHTKIGGGMTQGHQA